MTSCSSLSILVILYKMIHWGSQIFNFNGKRSFHEGKIFWYVDKKLRRKFKSCLNSERRHGHYAKTMKGDWTHLKYRFRGDVESVFDLQIKWHWCLREIGRGFKGKLPHAVINRERNWKGRKLNGAFTYGCCWWEWGYS